MWFGSVDWLGVSRPLHLNISRWKCMGWYGFLHCLETEGSEKNMCWWYDMDLQKFVIRFTLFASVAQRLLMKWRFEIWTRCCVWIFCKDTSCFITTKFSNSTNVNNNKKKNYHEQVVVVVFKALRLFPPREWFQKRGHRRKGQYKMCPGGTRTSNRRISWAREIMLFNVFIEETP